MEPKTSRRARTLARMKTDKFYGITPGFKRQIMDVIDCYEAELATDCENEDLIDRLIQEHWPIIPLTNMEILLSRDQVRALLNDVLDASE